jgi:hypothetical protein
VHRVPGPRQCLISNASPSLGLDRGGLDRGGDPVWGGLVVADV